MIKPINNCVVLKRQQQIKEKEQEIASVFIVKNRIKETEFFSVVSCSSESCSSGLNVGDLVVMRNNPNFVDININNETLLIANFQDIVAIVKKGENK